MVSKNAWITLGVVIVLAVAVRFYLLLSVPPSLNWDEVSHAYNGWSLLETGRDQWGIPLPVANFRAYGDYPTTLSLYGTVSSIALFGPTDFAVRFPGALLGALAAVLAFGCGYYWKRNWIQGGIMGLTMAIEPWTVFTSRQLLQSNWVVFFVMAFLYFFIRRKKIMSFVVLLISLFAYHNARIYVPLASGALFIAWGDKKSRILSVLLVVISLGILLAPASRARSDTVGILDSGAVAKIESQRNSSNLPNIVKKVLYNRPIFFAQKAVAHYVDYFSVGFLFLHGGTQYQFSVPNYGLLSYVDLPFFYLGLIIIVMEFPIVAILLLLAPIPAAITQDRFAVVRSTIMIPFVVLAVSVGIAKLKNKNLLVGYVGLLVIFLSGYYYNYMSDYRKNYSQSWQYGYKQAAEYLVSNQDQYDEIIFTKRYGEPHEYLLWYGKINPANYLADFNSGKVDWNFHDHWYWIDRIGKITFVNDWEMNKYLLDHVTDEKTLVISSADNPVYGKTLQLVKFLDDKLAFVIAEQ